MTLNSRESGQSNVMIGVIAVIVVAVLGAGAYFFTKSQRAEQPAAEVAANTAAPAPDATQPAAASTDTAAAPAPSADAPQGAPGTFNGTQVREGNPVVATVDGQPVNRLDVYRFIQTMPANVQQMPATTVYPIALEQMINARLVQNKADAVKDIESDPAFQAEMEIAKQQIARNVFIQKEVSKEISEDDLKDMYKKLVTDAEPIEERKAAHILLESEEKAKEVIKKLAAGSNFRDIALAHSIDPTVKENKGELGWFIKQTMVPEFADAAYKMNKGQVSMTPVKTQLGWHVILLEDIRTQEKPTFEQIKPALEMQARREKLDELMKDWREDAKVEIFDINGDPVKEGSNNAGAPAPTPETVAPAAAP